MTKRQLPGPPSINIRQLTRAEADRQIIQQILEGCPDYYQKEQGHLPGEDAANKLINDLPEGKTPSDKFVFGIFADNVSVGCADVLRYYPDEQTAFFGLLAIMETYQQQGYGSLAYGKIERIIRQWKNITKIRLAVLQNNRIIAPFWQRMGLTSTGETRPYNAGLITTNCHFFEKDLK